MTRAFLTLKDYEPLGAKAGDQLVQGDSSAVDLGMDALIRQGFFREMGELEALAYFKAQAAIKEKSLGNFV